ncbi:putative ribonuclease H domain, reverse transcriptase zinc-binding domain-containing protein [Arabidopsis thaliana]
MVQHLMYENTRLWNKEVIEDLIVEEDAALIQNIRLSSKSFPDLLGWSYTKNGEYLVKSGYWLSTHLRDQLPDFVPLPGSMEFKSAIWKLKTAPKIRHFLWRIITHSLATGENLTRRHIISDSQCKRCCSADETLDHLFFTCHHAQAIWKSSPLSYAGFFHNHLSFDDKFMLVLQCCNNGRLDDITRQIPLWILWRIWKSRNLLVYQRRGSSWSDDVQKAITDAYEWIPTQSESTTRAPSGHTRCGWKKPNHGFMKCNYDCSYRQGGVETNVGWIIRNKTGTFVMAAQSKGRQCNSALEAEFQGLLMAMQHTWFRGYKKIIFEGDNRSVAECVNGKARSFELHNLIRDIQYWQKKFIQAKVTWVPRMCNKVADCLAKTPFPNNTSFSFFSYVPSFVVQFLHEDYTSSL